MAQPKTGLAKRMREWMKARERVFTMKKLCDELDIPPGGRRERVSNSLIDFIKRGEVTRTLRGQYRYNHAWKRGDKSPLKAKVVKAMYVSASAFSMTDIRRLSGAREMNYIHKIARKLKAAGHIRQVGRRVCAHGAGAERVYRVVDRGKFRVEVLD